MIMSYRVHRWPGGALRRSLIPVAILGIIFTAFISSRNAAAEETDYSPPGKVVYIGTTYLHMHCVGEGSPTVLVDTGLGESAVEWWGVQQRLRHQSRVCLYDRAGYGWSDFGELPRSSSRIVNELYLLLRHAEITGPFVLIGHSYGGMNMQLFARRYPYLVSGLVLVDSSSPEQIGRLELPHLDAVDAIRQGYQGGVATQDFMARPVLPKVMDESGLGLLAVLMMSRVYTMRTVANEYLNFKASARQVMRNRGSLPDVPVAVLSRGQGEVSVEGQWKNGNEDAWRSLQGQLAGLAPRTAHIIATRSGHAIHAEQPDLVVDAATMVLDFARADAEARAGLRRPVAAGRATTWLPFADAVWIADKLHTSTDVCPFGCDDRYFDHVIGQAGHLAGTARPEWQRVAYRRTGDRSELAVNR